MQQCPCKSCCIKRTVLYLSRTPHTRPYTPDTPAGHCSGPLASLSGPGASHLRISPCLSRAISQLPAA